MSSDPGKNERRIKSQFKDIQVNGKAGVRQPTGVPWLMWSQQRLVG